MKEHRAVLVGLVLAAGCATVPQPAEPDAQTTPAGPYLVVLGIAQDAGVPQAGVKDHPGWDDSSRRHLAVSLGLVDPTTSQRWMFEATPDFKYQLNRLERLAPSGQERSAPDGIFLTHAHIGHYLGLALVGHESMGARQVAVYAMPRMSEYLSGNGPWDQLVRYENINLHTLTDGQPVQLTDSLRVTPFLVPHRQEYSEVVGYRIEGPRHKAIFLPDIDSWREWDETGTRLEEVLSEVDVAYLDGSFYADGEIPGRDMSGFPHPFITLTMERLASLPPAERNKVRFIHFNHTNPVLVPSHPARGQVESRGFRLAEELEIVEL